MADTGAYSNFEFLNDPTVTWFYDENCENEVADMRAEKPVEEKKYYGKVVWEPKSSGRLTAEGTKTVGVYTVTIISGQIIVTKEIENLDTAKALSYDGNPIFTFVLKKKNSQGGYDTVQTKAIDFGNQYQTVTKSVTFEKLGKGEYVVEELGAAGWTVSEGYQQTSNAMSINKTNKTGDCSFKNKAVKQKAFADKDIAVNSITKGEDGKIVFTKKQENNGN